MSVVAVSRRSVVTAPGLAVSTVSSLPKGDTGTCIRFLWGLMIVLKAVCRCYKFAVRDTQLYTWHEHRDLCTQSTFPSPDPPFAMHARQIAITRNPHLVLPNCASPAFPPSSQRVLNHSPLPSPTCPDSSPSPSSQDSGHSPTRAYSPSSAHS